MELKELDLHAVLSLPHLLHVHLRPDPPPNILSPPLACEKSVTEQSSGSEGAGVGEGEESERVRGKRERGRSR
eukprot:1334684-Rhodomonas_salina.1